MVVDILMSLLSIPSPTYDETALGEFIKAYLAEHTSISSMKSYGDSFIVSYIKDKNNPTVGLVGHLDVVPDFVEPFVEGDRIFGAGASDMQAGLAAIIAFVCSNLDSLLTQYNLQLVFYAKEERTALSDNGLFELIQQFKSDIQSIDCAIVAEPTDNKLQIGCVGSLHLNVKVYGQSCHSARPWTGDHALYKALPLIEKMHSTEPVKTTLYGVDYYNVIDITESHSEPGRTSVPGYWNANINYRFSPNISEKKALDSLQTIIDSLNIDSVKTELVDSVYAGSFVETDFSKQLMNRLGVSIEAKQAWTDIAQLSQLDVPGFNFGPGIQSQAHKESEYASKSQLEDYMSLLLRLLS